MANLASKYRPKSFDDMVEQEVVVKMVESLCKSSELDNRNFLFIGPAGCGKTTLARIISSVLNEGKGDPIEIDAASHSGVDSVRDIVEQAKKYPVGFKYKVFILDEVHSFSSAAWQAFLKVFEENPAKSVFLLCTTDPEKIPATIISRVQVFQLSKISVEGIVSRLKYVIESEIAEGREIEYDEDSINFLAKLAGGGLRDSLTLLDKVLAYSNVVKSGQIEKALNLPNYDDYFSLLQAYSKHKNEDIAEIIDRVYDSGINFRKWFEEFHAFVINIVKYIFLQDISKTLIPMHYEDKISKYGPAHSIVCLKLAHTLMELNHELKYTQHLQEVALTYLCNTNKRG